MTTEQSESRATGGVRATVGVVLFIVWGVLAFLWVYDALYNLAHGVPGPAIKSLGTLLLLAVLAGMEGLEVCYIHLWRQLHPDRTEHDLAAWLAARQLFVALIVVANTLLGDRHSIAVPFRSEPITGVVALQAFNIFFTTCMVLWFAQILPKHMAATNGDRYLKLTRAALSPVVEFVRRIGISWPAEQVAAAVESLLHWHAKPTTLERAPWRGEDLAEAWAALIPERPPEH
jgi:CBS domain containing-hemolysin-like protein